MDALVTAGDVYQCAGGLMVEHPLVFPHVLKIDGTIDSVMGLCKGTVSRLLGLAMQARAEHLMSLQSTTPMLYKCRS